MVFIQKVNKTKSFGIKMNYRFLPGLCGTAKAQISSVQSKWSSVGWITWTVRTLGPLKLAGSTFCGWKYYEFLILLGIKLLSRICTVPGFLEMYALYPSTTFLMKFVNKLLMLTKFQIKCLLNSRFFSKFWSSISYLKNLRANNSYCVKFLHKWFWNFSF